MSWIFHAFWLQWNIFLKGLCGQFVMDIESPLIFYSKFTLEFFKVLWSIMQMKMVQRRPIKIFLPRNDWWLLKTCWRALIFCGILEADYSKKEESTHHGICWGQMRTVSYEQYSSASSVFLPQRPSSVNLNDRICFETMHMLRGVRWFFRHCVSNFNKEENLVPESVIYICSAHDVFHVFRTCSYVFWIYG